MQYDARVGPGRLIYLMGPSGSGKDSLIDAVRSSLEQAGVRIARRVITRSAEAMGEAAHSVTPAQFARLLDDSAFALHWYANDLAYGIPVQIDDWLREGHPVLVNGSRAHLDEARERYPDLLPVLLTVEPHILRQRLLHRGREGLEAIERRLARNAEVMETGDFHCLDNSGALQDAAQRFLTLLQDQAVLVRN